jgi:hypothetical protein
MSAERSLKQIKMPPEQHEMLKMLAARKQKHLHQICADAIERLVVDRLHKNRHSKLYFVSPKQGNYQSYWLDTSLLREVALISELDDVSESRVIYTAFHHYLQKHSRRLALAKN